MCHDLRVEILLRDPELYRWLLKLDEDLAASAKADRCHRCKGRLDQANYPRKPRGGPSNLCAEYDLRFSFCCDVCRRRLTPPSVRFLGPKVYLGAVVVLVSAMLHGVSPPRAEHLHELFGVSRRTLGRWLGWWREVFGESRFFKAARGLMRSALDAAKLPLSLLQSFGDPGERETLVAMLQFLSPITTGSAPGSQPC